MDINILNLTTLIAFMGGRRIINDFHEKHYDILEHPLVQIIIIISILYMNTKDVRISILIFFGYILYLESRRECDRRVD